jgi:hypothetical protein
MIDQLNTVDLSDQFQRFVKAFVRVLEDNPRLDGRMIEGIALTAATPLPIDHKLARQPVGWDITDITWAGAADVAVRRTAWDATTITLESPVTNCTVSIWVY